MVHLVVCFQGSVLHGVPWCYDNLNNKKNNNKISRVNGKLEKHVVVIEAWGLSGFQEGDLSSAGEL